MALHKDFPELPYTILDPVLRWFPADETICGSSYLYDVAGVQDKFDRIYFHAQVMFSKISPSKIDDILLKNIL